MSKKLERWPDTPIDRSSLYSAYIPHERVPAEIFGDSMTKQEFRDESDINIMMDRYEKTAIWPVGMERTPRYLDCTEVPHMQEALHIMDEAAEAFMSLPAKVRKEFDNDTMKFVQFASDPANLGQMREWGLAAPEKEPDAPVRVELVNPPSEEEPIGKPPKAE